ncbi:type 4a pilus biogenesis protein PilO [Candidatus Uhrbacteria bacterium]|nr:type 4a pilus biogenesis protein PilO [Candidatus Uhrbacteria bacterium]
MRRLTTFLPALLALAAMVGIVVGLILPTFRRIQVTRAATVAEREQLERRYQLGRTRSRAALELAERELVLESLIRRIPHEETALAVVRSIEAIAATHQLEERIAIDWSTARTGGHTVDVPTTIELSGSYPNLVAALRDLERLPIPSAIEQFDLTTGASPGFGQPAPRARVQLVIHTSTLWSKE